MNHHYVPECYLKNFLTSDRNLTVIDLRLYKEHLKFKEQRKAPGAICYIPDYYSIDEKVTSESFFRELNQYSKNHIEDRAFLNFELNFKSHYDKLVGPEKSLDKHFWTKSIISLKKRNPYYLEVQDFHLLKEEATNNVRKYLNTITNEDDAFKALNHVVSRIDEENNAHKKFNLTTLIHDSQETDISSDAEKVIQSLQWDILIANENYPFTTTDNPGFAIASDGEFNSFKFLDDHRNVMFYMPISPTRCLRIMSMPNKLYIGKAVRELKLSKYETFAINLGGIKFARTWCISNTSGFFFQMQKEIISLYNFRNRLESFGFPHSFR